MGPKQPQSIKHRKKERKIDGRIKNAERIGERLEKK
jgi:hypothetical protein